MRKLGPSVRSDCAGPSATASSSATPGTDNLNSRSNSPASPLRPADCTSYGSAHFTPGRLTGEAGWRAGKVSGEREESRDNMDQKNAINIALPERMRLPLTGSNYSPSLTLENSGSVARDHLASERTFLAYVRTSLAIASAGVALVQLFSVSSNQKSSDQIKANLFRFARPLGATIVIIGILVLLIGFVRYFRIQAALIVGKFPPARLAVAFITSTIALLAAMIFGILVQAIR